jgi:FecR protein
MENIMKRFIVLLIVICFIGSLFAAENVAITLKAKGDVNLTREKELSKVKEGAGLYNSDELESKNESFAVIKFVDGSSLIKLFPNSILTINTDKTDGELNKKNSLKVGSLWAKVSKKTGLFEIDTPNTVVSVKGTEFILDVNELGQASLSVKEGEVTIKNKDSEKETIVLPGQKASEDDKGNINVAVYDVETFDTPEPTDGEEEDYEILKFNLVGENGQREEVELKLIKR